MTELRAVIDVFEGTVSVYLPGSLEPCFTAPFSAYSSHLNCKKWFMDAIKAPKTALAEDVVLTFLGIDSACEMSVDSIATSSMTGRWPKFLRPMAATEFLHIIYDKGQEQPTPVPQQAAGQRAAGPDPYSSSQQQAPQHQQDTQGQESYYNDIDNNQGGSNRNRDQGDGMGPGIDPETLGRDGTPKKKKEKGQNLLFPVVQDLILDLGNQYVASCPDTGLYIINHNKPTGNAVAASRPLVQTATDPSTWQYGLEFVYRSAWELQQKCHDEDKSAKPRIRLKMKHFKRVVRAIFYHINGRIQRADAGWVQGDEEYVRGGDEIKDFSLSRRKEQAATWVAKYSRFILSKEIPDECRYTVMQLGNLAQIQQLMQQGSSGGRPPRVRAPAGGSSMAPGRPPLLAATTPVPFQQYTLPMNGAAIFALPAPPIFSLSPMGPGLANLASAPGASGASTAQTGTASGQGSGHEAQSPPKPTSSSERPTQIQGIHATTGQGENPRRRMNEAVFDASLPQTTEGTQQPGDVGQQANMSGTPGLNTGLTAAAVRPLKGLAALAAAAARASGGFSLGAAAIVPTTSPELQAAGPFKQAGGGKRKSDKAAKGSQPTAVEQTPRAGARPRQHYDRNAAAK